MKCNSLQPFRNGEVLAHGCFNGRDLRRRLQGRLLIMAIVLALTTTGAFAQSSMACSAAVAQLQGYVQQVKTIAQVEYSRGIPSRCGYNAYCAQSLLQQLSMWYAQQSALVNQWYATLARQCTSQQPAARPKENDPTNPIDDVDDLQVDDQDKTVRIKIPSKPSGYSGSTP